MTYTKTNWVIGGPPGISAVRLNNMEVGIESAHNPTEVLERVKTVDGEGSGLNSDFVRGMTFRETNRVVEYSIDGGGTWYPVGGVSIGASNTIQYSENTTREVATGNYAQGYTNYMLVGKFIPKGTGDCIITFELQAESTSSYESDSAEATLMVFSSSNDLFDANYGPDWTTPLGTILFSSPFPSDAINETPLHVDYGGITAWTSYSKQLRIHSKEPVYIILKSFGSGVGYSRLRNIQVKYDVIG